MEVLEAFVLSNYAFLILDVYLAHQVNRFRHAAEWIPVGFSVAAVLVLAPALVLRLTVCGDDPASHRERRWVWLTRRDERAYRRLSSDAQRAQASFTAGRTQRDFHDGRLSGRDRSFSHHAGLVVGSTSVAVGLAGVLYHLDSQFFSQWTIQSLVYTAPFVAPVAYAGLGFLLLVNRMVPSRDVEWSRWVVFFALGGFVGNFGLSLADHAINGFFHATEWMPVCASAVAVGFTGMALVEQRDAFLRVAAAVLALQVVVGLAGFYFHAVADINGLSSSLFENFIYGAPVFAPLLFVDIVLLAMIGLWDMHSQAAPGGAQQAPGLPL